MSMHRLATRLSCLGLYPTRSSALSTTSIAARYSTAALTSAVDLSNLSDNPGSKSQRLRVGRGQGSGKGNTAARGHKGQKARAGNGGQPKPGYEGGQTRLIDRLPKRGFKNPEHKEFQPLNLDRLQFWIESGRVDATQTITMKHLLDSRCIHNIQDGVKLLGDGKADFKTPINIEVSRASKSAIKAIESCGGKITSVYYNKLGLRALTKPEKFDQLPRFARPMKKKDIAFYTDEANRGYLTGKAEIVGMDH
ncbi:ribosomal protein L18e/L15P [Gamsiella multidivaricata]|uniref:ribosomal protein L18e/L15P n=1 Tax=Gamsiella multidivaricata TaxID=101098 RepID=UPI002220B723|nr:ribosomal protein L18e/L15P [Gamsiella multidivaricata]KAG0368466.1 YmL10 [Gamsiella multidivaricata]KAI7821936.1 ribosomal protein L18e/L15P [Gamsiella multidivaricata]